MQGSSLLRLLAALLLLAPALPLGGQAGPSAPAKAPVRLPSGVWTIRVTVDSGVPVTAVPLARQGLDTTSIPAPRIHGGLLSGWASDQNRSGGDTLYFGTYLPDTAQHHVWPQVSVRIPWKDVSTVEWYVRNDAAINAISRRGGFKAALWGAAIGALVSPRSRPAGAGTGALLFFCLGSIYSGSDGEDHVAKCWRLVWDRRLEAARLASGQTAHLGHDQPLRCDPERYKD